MDSWKIGYLSIPIAFHSSRGQNFVLLQKQVDINILMQIWQSRSVLIMEQ